MIEKIEGPRGHWYKIDGRKADGVTTLLSNGLPKKALMYWSAKCVAQHVADNLTEVDRWLGMPHGALVAELKGMPWAKRDKAAVQGSEVHGLAERLSTGDEVEVPAHLAGYVNSALSFLDDWEVRPILTETTVASRKWGYCGSFDGFGTIRGGTRVLFDYKTSASGVYGETALQLAAYANAEVYLTREGTELPVKELGIQQGLAVWLRPDGYTVYEMDISAERAFKLFLHAAFVARNAALIDAELKSDALAVPSV